MPTSVAPLVGECILACIPLCALYLVFAFFSRLGCSAWRAAVNTLALCVVGVCCALMGACTIKVEVPPITVTVQHVPEASNEAGRRWKPGDPVPGARKVVTF